jgi:beta-N-acetylhexosaminidase
MAEGPGISRRTFLRYAGPGAAALLLAGCAPSQLGGQAGPDSASLLNAVGDLIQQNQIHQFAAPPPMQRPLRAHMKLSDIPLAWKIGQMILVGFRGVTVDSSSPIVQEIQRYHVGGVVFFRHNVATPEQVLILTSALQRASLVANGLPLIISMDQEGGLVNRLNSRFGLSRNYSAADLGRLDDIALTRSYGEEIALNLRRVGINMNLAPVVDLNTNARNPVIGALGRSFSPDPEVVSRQASAFIQGHQAHGVLCSLKHFPGHGSSTRDSHYGFVDVTDTWQESELLPFARLIQSQQADAVMTAHIFNARLDPQLPATLSPFMIDHLLRQDLGYQGLVITDDLQMDAIRRYYSFDDAIRLAILAGVDVLSLSNNLLVQGNGVERVVQVITRMVADGLIDVARIDRSYRRILAVKEKVLVGQSMTAEG